MKKQYLAKQGTKFVALERYVYDYGKHRQVSSGGFNVCNHSH